MIDTRVPSCFMHIEREEQRGGYGESGHLQVFSWGFFALCTRTCPRPKLYINNAPSKRMLRQWERSMHKHELAQEQNISAHVSEQNGYSKSLNGAWCLFQCNEALQWSGIIFGCLTKAQSTFHRLTNGAWARSHVPVLVHIRVSPWACYAV